VRPVAQDVFLADNVEIRIVVSVINLAAGKSLSDGQSEQSHEEHDGCREHLNSSHIEFLSNAYYRNLALLYNVSSSALFSEDSETMSTPGVSAFDLIGIGRHDLYPGQRESRHPTLVTISRETDPLPLYLRTSAYR
jgi:hypothetical protein